MSKTIELTDSNFDEEISSREVPILVDYWAEWCGPCKMVGPILEELANDFEGKLVVGKVDVDTNKDSAAKQKVMSIPTLVLFKNGQPVDQRVGALTKNQLEESFKETQLSEHDTETLNVFKRSSTFLKQAEDLQEIATQIEAIFLMKRENKEKIKIHT